MPIVIYAKDGFIFGVINIVEVYSVMKKGDITSNGFRPPCFFQVLLIAKNVVRVYKYPRLKCIECAQR